MKFYHQILRNEEGGGEGDSGGGGGSATLLEGGGDGSQGSEGNDNTGDGHEGGSEVVSKPFFHGLYDESGKLNKDRLDALPDHLKDGKDLFGKYDTIEALLAGMRNAANLAGKKGLQPLPEGAPKEVVDERNALMRQLNNTPDSPEGYGFKKPDDWPESLPWQEERATKYAEILHRHNVSPELAKELYDLDMSEAMTQFGRIDEIQAETFAAEQQKLKSEFGSQLPEKVALAVRGVNSMGLKDENGEPITASHPIFKNAVAVKMAAAYAEAVSEDRLVSGDGDGSGGMSDREKALDILNNPNNPHYKAYHDPEHPGHEQAVKLRSRLNQRFHERQKSRS